MTMQSRPLLTTVMIYNILTLRKTFNLVTAPFMLWPVAVQNSLTSTSVIAQLLLPLLSSLNILNLRRCFKVATNKSLKAIGSNCQQLESINLGWCKEVGNAGVMSLAYGCPNLRAIDLRYCVSITDESVIALANNCLRLRSLSLHGCGKITDRAMYALADGRVRSKLEEGLTNLNINWIHALTAPAVQAVCDSFPELHTCPDKRSLILDFCWNLESVQCACTHVHSS